MGFRFPNLATIHRTFRSLQTNRHLHHYHHHHHPHPNRQLPSLLPSIDRHHHHRQLPSLILSIDRHCHQNHSRTTTRSHVGHSHHHHHHIGEGGEASEGVFKMGFAADIALAAGKTFTGYASGSTAIIADAAHSMSDIVLSGIAWLSFRAGKVPKDNEHPYGHGKFETLGALGISCMLLTTAGGIAWHAVDVLQVILASSPDMVSNLLEHDHHDHNGHVGHHHGIDLDHPVLALSMTVVSIAVKEGLYRVTRKAGERQGSGLMKANAWHHRADAVSSVVALIGVGGAISGMPLLDPVAGIFVSGMILKAGLETGYQSVMELVDAGVPSPILDPIKETIIQVEGVKGCHRLRGRKAGSFLYLDVHIVVDPFLSVSAAHEIGENVRLQNSHHQVAEVFIHIDPSYLHCSSTSDQRENLEGAESQYPNCPSQEQDSETIVADIISSKYAEKMTVEHITRHLLQGNILLEVQVSMPLEMSIREAMKIAREAEKEILKASPCINQVSIQLTLGNPIPLVHSPTTRKNGKKGSQN